MASRRDTPPSPEAENDKPAGADDSGVDPTPDAGAGHLNFAEEDELGFDFETQPEYSSSPTRRPANRNGGSEAEQNGNGAGPAPETEAGPEIGGETEVEVDGGAEGDEPSAPAENGNGAATAAASFEPTALQRPEPGSPLMDIPPPPGVDEVPVSGKPAAPWAEPTSPDKRRQRLNREKQPLRKRAVGKLRVPGRSNGKADAAAGNGSGNGSGGGIVTPPPAPSPKKPPKRPKPKLKKLRALFVICVLGVIAFVSTVFGMMMAVAGDLPAIENFVQYSANQNSVMVDANGEEIGTLTSDENRILLKSSEISSTVKNAVVSIEDARFYEHGGVDFRGIGRALGQDVLSLSAQQGASTIEQQFVKNALETQDSRTVLEKLREAALSYHLDREWSKDKILTAYLNTIYFGEGAYGIEAAARTYFGWNHPGCGTQEEPCASVLLPAEAATLAGLIASPYAFDPKLNPNDSKGRRNVVLEKMLEQGYISEADYKAAIVTSVPAASNIHPPTIDSKAPYFSTWVRQQLVDRYGPGPAYYGGLKVKTTLDLGLQEAAEADVRSYLGGIPPTAAVVVIDNHNGAVKAMVGGPNFEKAPFNIATNGHRQPGSSIKPFTLITALKEGISPYTVYPSAPQTFHFGKKGKEIYSVSNDEDSYLGSCDIICATTYSDNSIYAQLGLESLKGKDISARTHSIARTIHDAGYRDPISTNPGMVLGGLNEGVTPLQWTYAYSTIANNGDRVSGTLAPVKQTEGGSPVAFTRVEDKDGDLYKGSEGENDSTHFQAFPEDVATEAKSILSTVVSSGTGTNANIGASGQWGKTGTTENNGDAWFCGATEDVTACVWVGYANSVTPMTTDYGGQPVMGGTYPALIWASVISDWEEISAQNAAERAARKAEREAGDSSDDSSSDGSSSYSPVPDTSTYEAPSTSSPAPVTPAPTPTPAPAPTPTPAPAAPTPAAPSAPAPSTSGGGISGGAGPAG